MKNGRYPEKVRWIKTAIKKNMVKLPEKILTEDDVKRLGNAARNTRFKAFVSLREGREFDDSLASIQLTTLFLKLLQFIFWLKPEGSPH